MSRDEIIAIAREAGMEVHERKGQIRIGSAVLTGVDSTDEVTRFAALVAAREREACALVAMEYRRGAGDPVCGEVAAAIRERNSNVS